MLDCPRKIVVSGNNWFVFTDSVQSQADSSGYTEKEFCEEDSLLYDDQMCCSGHQESWLMKCYTSLKDNSSMEEKDVTNKRTFLRELSFIHEPIILCTDCFHYCSFFFFFFLKQHFKNKLLNNTWVFLKTRPGKYRAELVDYQNICFPPSPPFFFFLEDISRKQRRRNNSVFFRHKPQSCNYPLVGKSVSKRNSA